MVLMHGLTPVGAFTSMPGLGGLDPKCPEIPPAAFALIHNGGG
jgi:hypothetical protein